ncbi:MAG: hypothetical protein ACE5HT_12155 [Gemmatimonadales bacterium]
MLAVRNVTSCLGSCALLSIVSPSLTSAQQSAPLFESLDPLAITVRAPLNRLFKDRGSESEERPGTVEYVGSEGDTVSLDVKIKTRGNSRLRRTICGFPPLRLNFQKKQTKGTVFDGQDRLKLVTHCQDSKKEYEQYLLKEYLIYRAFNLFSDLSFRVRLLRVTYVDSEKKKDPLTKYGFLIERDAMMAARNGVDAVKVRVLSPDYVDPEYLSLVEVFEYMIGNPDWSAFAPEKGKDECCHNTDPVGSMQGPVFPVPYDFDITGVVEPRYYGKLYGYSAGSRRGKVTDRVYYGLCRSQVYLNEVLQRFRDKRDDIYALFREQEGLETKVAERVVSYLDDFYKVVNDPKKLKREITDNCRGGR